jgi:hypothetical protein
LQGDYERIEVAREVPMGSMYGAVLEYQDPSM